MTSAASAALPQSEHPAQQHETTTSALMHDIPIGMPGDFYPTAAKTAAA